MKCIYCDSDTKYRVRKSNGGRCGGCQHPFAFEPRDDAAWKITDGLFQRVIKEASADGTVWFTERHLWYELNRRLWRRRLTALTPAGGAVAGVSVLAGALLSVGFATAWPLLLAVPGIALAAILSRRGRRQAPRHPPLPFGKFHASYLSRWISVHGSMERLLPSPAPRPGRLPAHAEPDLTAYSFDRALVTDRDETAAMLVANQFHVENNCAILSEEGYPGEMAETVLAMLRRNPQLKLFALHDASARGCCLPLALREARWFPDPALRVIDLGLRPRHADSLRLFTLPGPPASLPPVLLASLPAAEALWLEQGNNTELAALRPARLMRAVYQGFARAAQVPGAPALADAGGGGDGGVWVYDSGADVYAADSFG